MLLHFDILDREIRTAAAAAAAQKESARVRDLEKLEEDEKLERAAATAEMRAWGAMPAEANDDLRAAIQALPTDQNDHEVKNPLRRVPGAGGQIT